MLICTHGSLCPLCSGSLYFREQRWQNNYWLFSRKNTLNHHMKAVPNFSHTSDVLALELAEGTVVLLLPPSNSAGSTQKPKKENRWKKKSGKKAELLPVKTLRGEKKKKWKHASPLLFKYYAEHPLFSWTSNTCKQIHVLIFLLINCLAVIPLL